MSYIDPPTKLLMHIDRIQMVKEGLNPPPINVEIDLSNRCSLGCEGCHFAHTHTRGPLAGSEKPPGFEETGDLMDYHQARVMLDELYIAGARSITWTGGGEPTLHPNFNELVEYSKIPQGIYTNGAHINQERAGIMKKNMTWIYVSLDYADQRWYEVYKKSRLFPKVMEGIRNLVEADGNATIGLGYLIWEKNWTNISTMYRLGQDLGVDYINFRPMIWHKLDKQDEVQEDTSWMTDAIGMLEYYAKLPDVICDVARFKDYQNWNGRIYDQCWWSKLQTVITPNGKVWTCVNRRGFDGDCRCPHRRNYIATH